MLQSKFDLAFALGYKLDIWQRDDFTFQAGIYQHDGRRYTWGAGVTIEEAVDRAMKSAEKEIAPKEEDFSDLVGDKKGKRK